MDCESKLAKTEDMVSRLGQVIVRIQLHCAVMNDKIEELEKEGKDVSLVRELITQIMTEIGA